MMSSEFKEEDKDVVIFQTVADQHKPFSDEVRNLVRSALEDDDEIEGPIKANGEINWGCPCMAGMVSGPCGYAFREAFSCFHFSKAEPKGSDCIEAFKAMSDCFRQYPGAYPLRGKDEDDDDDDDDLWANNHELEKKPDNQKLEKAGAETTTSGVREENRVEQS